MAIFQVKSWYSGDVIIESEAESLKEVVEAAVRSKADLRCTDLRDSHLNGADLRGANLSCADLHGADLRGANLRGAELRGANLSCVDLHGADLSRADLSCANLCGAELRGTNLCGAQLRGANLRGAHFNWNSHELMSAVLLQESEYNIERMKVSGLILCLRDWCWDDFFKLRSDSQFSWAMDTLAGYVVDEVEAPGALVNWKNRSSEASGEGGLS